jgi:hypothetical protein
LPAATPASIRQLLCRCLTKDPKQRLRDIGDARLEIDEMSRTRVPVETGASRNRWEKAALLPSLALIAASGALGLWLTRRPAVVEDAFATAQFSELTNWEGTEAHADISPDGRFVVFCGGRRWARRTS